MIKDTPPKWFADVIITGLQRMHAIGLKFRPSSKEELMAMGELWIETLWYINITWIKELDSDRLAKAFGLLIANTKEWPTPAEYMQWLSNLPRAKQMALPAPPVNKDVAAKEMTKIRELVGNLVKSKRM